MVKLSGLEAIAVFWLGVVVGVIGQGLHTVPASADVPHPSFAHPGSMVVFVHYMPPYEGDPRAAMVLEYPHACPPDTPNDMTDCANLRFWTKRPDEIENPTNVLDGAGLPTGEHTNNGDDWRCCVPHDPTGKVPRSWHLWGEAPGEEAR